MVVTVLPSISKAGVAQELTGLAVHQNRACAANLDVATFSRSLETQVIAKKVGE